MSDRYDQPFCTIGSVGVFKYATDGYIPALEPPYADTTDTLEVKRNRPIPMSEKDKAGHRRGEMLYLLGKVQEIDRRLKDIEDRISRRRKHGVY